MEKTDTQLLQWRDAQAMHSPEGDIELKPESWRRLPGGGDATLILKDKTQHSASMAGERHAGQQPTWKTLMMAWGKLSKLLRRTSTSSKSYLPPKSCMPSKAKMVMKRKSSSSREAMEQTELSRDATRLLSDVQYLREEEQQGGGR